jgi:dynein heavy chain
LAKQLFKEGGQMCVKLGDAAVPYHADFRLYFSTALAAPHFRPEVCVKVLTLSLSHTRSLCFRIPPPNKRSFHHTL